MIKLTTVVNYTYIVIHYQCQTKIFARYGFEIQLIIGSKFSLGIWNGNMAPDLVSKHKNVYIFIFTEYIEIGAVLLGIQNNPSLNYFKNNDDYSVIV